MATVTITTHTDSDFFRGFIYQTEAGTPIDMTGDKLRMGIRRRAEDATEEMLLTTENGALAITNPSGGRFTVGITQTQLLELGPGEYEHSLIRIRTNGQKLRMWSGTLFNNAGPSR